MLPKVKTILYATGMGAGAPHVFRYALMMAKQHDAKIIAVSVLETLSEMVQNIVAQYVPPEQREQIHHAAQQSSRDKLRERINQLCTKECENDQDSAQRLVDIRIEDGMPAQAILKVAEEINPDIIIMGSHRHTAIGDAILGATTRKVLHSATTPVLVVRIPDGFHEEGF
ncbi:Nucleotide-binding universal stress protein, UspA family [Desulfuromusa kysingii]|uniref:Nucleotide-binding universal stress protein, UspA family n=1 Tax=Desulfuromusa kysingii TaxID=37625 RepID=A0A1H3XIU4_9BACT|nr:universal stress protein [Desulfuromusa kysingii]SDZ99180.1 Nucleotide-binding universal stress protein, UspA family [Desulfuromusa kysingii]